MPKFSEQLTNLRKARNMTQEQLAQVLDISRSRISRWENGNAIPDIVTVRHISQTLQYDFFADKDIETAPETPAAAKMPEVTKMPEKRPCCCKKHALFALAGAVVLVIILVLVLALGKKPAVVQSESQHELYSLAWYQEAIAPVEKHSNVVITSAENPVRAIRFEDFTGGVGWFYTFTIEEMHGVPFHISQIVVSEFAEDGYRRDSAFDTDQIVEIFGTNVVGIGSPMSWMGGFPLQDVIGVGLAVHGKDANGRAMVFRGYLELSQEIKTE